ncbi:unnamed protein product [Linum tenue]|uniref:DUF3741 domain-containing protein n=1 Tax=Linum tenue TaxID=586396 RepID=A0AAV0GNS4_9ROSI|nr:unnamed protein product [Linum tenue]
MKPEAAAFLSSLSSSGASPSSSSRREAAATAADSSDSPGCMAGILRIVSRYHNGRRRRRFLTFRRPSAAAIFAGDHKQSNAADTGKSKPTLAREVPRSPTIPPEIRRSPDLPPKAPGGGSNSHNRNTNTTRQALVARLMGLDDGGGGAVAAEQRRKLLGALEKCDEDLKALKEMIDEVKKSVGGDGSAADYGSFRAPAGNDDKEAELEEENRSDRLTPLSEWTRPYHNNNHYNKSHAPSTGGGGIPRQQKKKPGDHEEGIFFFDISAKRPPPAAAAATMIGHRHPSPSTTMESLLFPCRGREQRSNKSNSSTSEKKAMAESVERACSDIAWGQKREVGRIGLALQDHICRDLVEEFVREVFGHYLMNKYYKFYYDSRVSRESCDMISTLPFDACKRSLRF